MKRISDSDLLSYHRGDMDQGTTRQIMASELILARRVIEASRIWGTIASVPATNHGVEVNEVFYNALKAYDEGVK